MDLGQVPGRIADIEASEMAISVRYLEAAAVDGDGAFALALGALLGPGEGDLERSAVGTGPHHRGAFEKSCERRFVQLRMGLAVVIWFDPGLGRPRSTWPASDQP